MKKTMIVEGMKCVHCAANVEKALTALEGVSAAVINLEAKSVEVTMTAAVADDVLSKAVTDAGYQVVSIA